MAHLSYVNVFRTEHYVGPMVNLDRPELSPCLARVKKTDPRHRKLLAAIREGSKRLKDRPRGDVMEGLVPHGRDRYTLEHRKKYLEYERLVRKAIREGRELRDSDLAKVSRKDK